MNIYHFSEYNFTVIANAYEYHVEYTIYDHEETEDDGPMYHKKDSDYYPDPVENVEDADIYMHGYIKWDGCSNWYIDEQDRGMLHGCTRNDCKRAGDIIARCWDLTRALCKNWYDPYID